MDRHLVMKYLTEDQLTYAEIARKLGVSRQAVHQLVNRKYKFTPITETQCIYKGLRNWLNANHIKIRTLARICYDCDYLNSFAQILYHQLNGERELKKSSIDKILAVTELTYEQAFGKEN